MKKKQLNPFQELIEYNAPSGQIKRKVMASAKFNHLVIQVADLFIIKPIAIIGALIKTNEQSN